MADIETTDVLRIGATMIYEDVHEITNVYHVRVTAGGGLSYAVAAADVAEYMESIYGELEAQLSDELDSDYLTLANVSQDTTFGAFAWTNPWTGSASASQLPPGLCCLTWARTLKPRVQIRKYYGPFSEDQILDGVWSSPTRAACLAAINDHIQSFEGANGLVMLGVAYSREHLSTTDALSATTALEPAYQRRRKRGRGS